MVMKVFLAGLGEDQDVFQEHKDETIQHVPEHIVHCIGSCVASSGWWGGGQGQKQVAKKRSGQEKTLESHSENRGQSGKQ